MPAKFVFRAVGLPNDAQVSDIEELKRFCEADEKLVTSSVSFVPSCPDDGETKTAIFAVQPPLPKFLENLRKNSTQTFVFELRQQDVQLDMNFYGFTQMYTTNPQEPITAE
jgi:hypothetical protein